MILFYHLLVTLGFCLVLPFLPIVYLASEKRRANLLPRLGIRTGFSRPDAGRKRIWVHALSVGEVRSALPLVSGLRQRYPDHELVFTASTRTGYDTARDLYAGRPSPLVDQTGYFPFDLPWAVARVIGLVRPDLVCLVETDLWPGFLSAASRRKIPVILANARLSRRSFNGYRRLGPGCGLFFSGLNQVMAQTPLDADRFEKLGVPKYRISIPGNIKFDQPRIRMDADGEAAMRKTLGLLPGHRVLVAGSTHDGEEEMILAAFNRVRQQIPELRLVLAPRDPARSGRVEKLAVGCQCDPVRMSRLGERPDTRSTTRQEVRPEPRPQTGDVVIIDRLGVLARAYAVGDVAFIGGSLVPLGGHNPLEPAMFAKPVLFGPHMTDCFLVAEMMTRENAAFEVDTADALAGRLERLLADPDLARDMGHRALDVFNRNAGAVARTLDRLAERNDI